jgi:glycosyltransferase involved in cell wall biosynthesis
VSLKKVLHIDTEMSWRGGENQIRLLLQNAQNAGVEWHLSAPPRSQAILRMANLARTLPVAMDGVRQFTAVRTIARYCKEQGIDLIDCQSSRAHQLGLLVKYSVPSLKLIVHRRVDYPPGRSWINRLKYINSRVDRYIAISQAIADILIDYGVPQQSISVVRSAVDPAPFVSHDRSKAREKLLAELGVTLPASTPIIGNLAYITEQKGHETLIRALGLLKAQGLPFFAFIAGDGELRQKSESLAASLQLEANLKFLGIRKDVAELLAASDIFALSSNDEGLGTSLLDATHAGCCLVATQVGGIPEIISHQQTGLLSPARDYKAFALNLTEALKSEALREKLSSKAKAFVQNRFSLEQMVEGNLEIYRRLIQTF